MYELYVLTSTQATEQFDALYWHTRRKCPTK